MMVIDACGKRTSGAPIDRYRRGPIVTTHVNGGPLGGRQAADVTRVMIEIVRGQWRTADLALLPAPFNWGRDRHGGEVPAAAIARPGSLPPAASNVEEAMSSTKLQVLDEIGGGAGLLGTVSVGLGDFDASKQGEGR